MRIEDNKRKKLRLDLFLVIPTVFLCIIGLISLLSTTIDNTGAFGDLDIVYKQIIFIVFGLGCYLLLSFLDFSWFRYWQVVLPIYIVTIALLILVLLIGPVINNVQRWLVIGGIQIQPSEIAKFTVILTTATILSYKDRYNEWLLFGLSLLLTLPIVVLIYMEPGGSMSLLTLTIWFLVAFTGLSNQLRNTIALSIVGCIVGAFLLVSITGNWFYSLLGLLGLIITIFAYYYKGNFKQMVLITFCVSVILGGISTFVYEDILRDYQKDRIEAFFNPTETSSDIGFNVNQARIAIGSGQIFGKGFGNGTQSKRDFLPEHQTDFIFASFAEEFGLVGSLFLLSMYGIIITRILITSVDNTGNPFFAMLLIGVAMKMLLEVFINIGTNTGAIPATGIPLPLVSAGGSITVISLFSLGVIQSIMNSSKTDGNVSKIIDNYELIT